MDMPKIRLFVIGLSVMLAFVISPAMSMSKLIRFEFENYDGEGTFSLYRLDVNQETREGRLCFVNSIFISNMSDELPGIVYRGESWTGHLDFDREKNKACSDIELASGVDWFSSPQAIKYGDYEYQFFFIGKISPFTNLGKTSYFLDGDLTIFMRKNIAVGKMHDIFTSRIRLSKKKNV